MFALFLMPLAVLAPLAAYQSEALKLAEKPPLFPSALIFVTVKFLAYFLVALAVLRVRNSKITLAFTVSTLISDFLISALTASGLFLASFFLLLAKWTLTVCSAISAYSAEKRACLFFLPEVILSSFTGYLLLSLYLLN